MSGILEGVKVLDFGRYIAGPFCGALLADYGADVIRIERVSGSEDRYVTPVTEDGQGAMYLQLNRNKLGLTLNPTKEKSKDGIKVEQVDGLEGWAGVGVMAVANTRVVRRSAALMEQNQKPYGNNFTFGEHGLFATKRTARLASLGLVIGFLVLSTPLKHLVRPFLPKPGEGPSHEKDLPLA